MNCIKINKYDLWAFKSKLGLNHYIRMNPNIRALAITSNGTIIDYSELVSTIKQNK